MALDNSIFKSWLHLLPMDRIKSRRSSFSILSRWMIYACSATISLGSESLRGLPFFRGGIPALSLRCRSLYRDIQLWICAYSRPSLWAFSRLVIYKKMLTMGIHSLSAYIRKMALDGYCLYLDLKELHRMAYLLQMCSNNLNQYTHEAHLTGYLYPQDVEALNCQLEELTDLARQILSRLTEL